LKNSAFLLYQKKARPGRVSSHAPFNPAQKKFQLAGLLAAGLRICFRSIPIRTRWRAIHQPAPVCLAPGQRRVRISELHRVGAPPPIAQLNENRHGSRIGPENRLDLVKD